MTQLLLNLLKLFEKLHKHVGKQTKQPASTLKLYPNGNITSISTPYSHGRIFQTILEQFLFIPSVLILLGD